MMSGCPTTQETGVDEKLLGALSADGVEYVVLDLCGDGEVAQFLRGQPEWSVDYEDDEAVIFVHAASLNGGSQYVRRFIR